MAVFDTNIIVDYLNGHPPARTELDAVKHPLASIISWAEVLVGIPEDTRPVVEAFFAERFEVVPLDEEVARQAVRFRLEKKLKLLDAVVLATAFMRNTVLVTRDTDFKADDPLVRIPYRL